MSEVNQAEVDAVARAKRYWIQIAGFDGHEVVAKSAGAARYADFRFWREAGYGQGRTFRDFLSRIEAFHHLGPTDAHRAKAGVGT